MILKEIFGKRVKILRIQKNIKQSELGKIVGLSDNAISDIERGYKLTSMEKLIALADYFEVSVDYLMGRTDIRDQIISTEGNLDKSSIEYKNYREIEDKILKKLIDENVIEEKEPLTEEALDKIIKYGIDAAIEILKLKKERQE
jgi:transcriptional regulator with XRE-family HTH domain